MSKDYKPRQNKNNSKGSPFLTGLLIGFLLGVVTVVAFTMYLKGDTSPFQDTRAKKEPIETIAEKAEAEKVEEAKETTAKKEEPESDFDFYTDLPETETKVTAKEIKANPTVIKTSLNFLQIGAFQKEEDADNMKAKLALQGFEAVVQTASIPDKGTWHRVRIGPLNNVERINKMRRELLNNGFKADLIKVRK